jgi:hypothetical protein
MRYSVFKELEQFAIDLVVENVITKDNLEDAHHIAFNQDYYVIGSFQADQWLDSHDITPWEAMDYTIEQEKFHFGESTISDRDVNSESIVNLLVYFAGFDVDFEKIQAE